MNETRIMIFITNSRHPKTPVKVLNRVRLFEYIIGLFYRKKSLTELIMQFVTTTDDIVMSITRMKNFCFLYYLGCSHLSF